MSQVNQIAVSPHLLEDVVSLVEVASLTTKRAVDEIAVHQAAQKKASAIAGSLLDHMIKIKVVPETEKQAAEAMLGAHDTTLQLLKLATDKIAEQNAELIRLANLTTKTAGLGVGVDAATAAGSNSSGYNSLTHPIVGGHVPGEMKESDKALMRFLS